jgi:hypothetical protein
MGFEIIATLVSIEDTQSKKKNKRQGELLLPQNHENLSFKLFSLSI